MKGLFLRFCRYALAMLGISGVISCDGDDDIISVGYRVNSKKATQFRIWATKVLKEYMQKGFVLDDDRLKQGQTAFGKDYFRELLERVRSIRASDRRSDRVLWSC